MVGCRRDASAVVVEGLEAASGSRTATGETTLGGTGLMPTMKQSTRVTKLPSKGLPPPRLMPFNPYMRTPAKRAPIDEPTRAPEVRVPEWMRKPLRPPGRVR